MGNIFDEAARQGQNKHKKIKPGHTLPANPAPAVPNAKSSRSDKFSQEDAEVAEMFQRMHEMKRDLDRQLETVYEKGKQQHVNVDQLVNNMSHMLVQDYEKIKETESKVAKDFGPNVASPKMKSPQKSEEKLTQERKAKMRGARQKWIPM